MHYWSDSIPQILHESSLRPEKITVWCGGVIGPYFFPDEQDRYITENGKRYRSMITEYFWSQLDDMGLEDMWFRQDGATSHTSNVIINLLETKFAERVNSRKGSVGWPSRSCDLMPLDYFLWGYVKSTSHRRLMNFVRISNAQLQQYRPDFCKRAHGGHAKKE